MAINLSKGGSIDLTKNNPGLSKVTLGLSWGKASSGGGLLGALFGGGNSGGAIDLDSAILMVDDAGRKYDLVYFGHRRSQGVYHKGDDRTGNNKFGDYDNEEIEIDLNKVPTHVTELNIIAHIYNAGSKHFGQVKGAYARVLETDTRNELVRYNLDEQGKGIKGMVVGKVYRYRGEWKFKALGQGTSEHNLSNIVRTILS